MEIENARRAAELLVKARNLRERLPALPADLLPVDFDDAYQIQDESIRLYGGVGGWKVSPPNKTEGTRGSPVAVWATHLSPAVLSWDKLPSPEVEVEIGARFVRDLPKRAKAYEVEDVMAAIGSTHAAIEILSSRFQSRVGSPRASILADCQSNGAVIVGAGLVDWRPVDYGSVAMRLFFNEQEVAAVPGGFSTKIMLDSLTWLANHATKHDVGLRAGQVAITAARIGPIALPARGTRVRAEVAGFDDVRVVVE